MAKMRGQNLLEALRRSGHAPVTVDICLYETKPWVTQDWAIWYPQFATLQADKPDRAALRCIVGLDVNVSGDDAERVHAMRDACVEAGASRVVATVFENKDSGPDYERCRAIEVTDTKGLLTWHR